MPEVSCCFNESEQESLIAFCTYLSQHCEKLKKLSLRSDKYNFIGKYTVSLLISLQFSNLLEYLDMSNSSCGNSGVSQLLYLLKTTNSINTVHFDGSKPTSCTCFADLLEKVVEIMKERNFFFQWPEKDLTTLLLFHKLRHQKYNSLKEAFTRNDNFLYSGEINMDFIDLATTDFSPCCYNKHENQLCITSTSLSFTAEHKPHKQKMLTMDPSNVTSSSSKQTNLKPQNINHDSRRKRKSLGRTKIIPSTNIQKDDTPMTFDPSFNSHKKKAKTTRKSHTQKSSNSAKPGNS